jgi:glycosyltransferase involved in cell wall biosynthesis
LIRRRLGANIASLRRRVAATVQRFGPDVIGGERLALQVLERLSGCLDLTVLTTCARDYVSWRNHYPAGERQEGRLRVIRFPVATSRPIRTFHLLSRFLLQRRLPWLRPPFWLENLWIRLQGPYCPALLRYIADQQDSFEAFLFYTYLYYPTVKGLPLVARRSILIPEAHDERPLYLRPYRALFEQAAALVCLSPEEQALVNETFSLAGKPQRVASLGMNVEPRDSAASLARMRAFRATYGIDRPYFLYVGRVDVAKGVERMLSYFERWAREERADCLLVLAGSRSMAIPESGRIRHLGEIPDEDRRGAVAGAQALLLFSPYESLSLSLLESFALGRPAIVTSDSTVLSGHISRSGAGFAVSSYEEFAAAATRLLTVRESELGLRGQEYVRQNYRWESVEAAYQELIELVAQPR